MDNNLITAIVIAAVAIIPGIWSLLTQIKKEKRDIAIQMANLREDISYTRYSIPDRIKSNIAFDDSITDRIWKKMYEKPAIVRCEHCKSPNVITSLNCIQCGAPLGD